MATTTINASEDTYISYLNPDSNYHLLDTFRVALRQVRTTTNTASNVSYDVEASTLYKYDLAELPQGTSSITSATLHIYGGGSTIQAPAVKIIQLNTDFDENTVTWNTGKPTYGQQRGTLNVFRKSLPTLAQTIGNADRWQTADVTELVTHIFNAPNENNLVKIALNMSTGYPVITTFKGILADTYQSYLTVVST